MKKLLLTTAVLLALLPLCKSQTGDQQSSFNFPERKHNGNENHNKAVALAVLRAFGTGNIDFIINNIANDGIDYGEGSTPPVVGKDSIRASLTAWLSSLENYKSSNPLAIAEGDYVFIYADWAGTFKVDFMGLTTKGKSFAYKDVDIFKFNKRGKITEHRAVQSLTTIIVQVTSQSAAPITMVDVTRPEKE